MNRNDASDSDQLQAKLDEIKSISVSNFDHSSILDTLEKKVQELLLSQEENLKLKKKIQVLSESYKLLAAKSSCAQQDYEAKISELAKELQNAKGNTNTNKNSSEKQVAELNNKCKTLENENAAIIEKYKKLKSKNKKAIAYIQELEKNYEGKQANTKEIEQIKQEYEQIKAKNQHLVGRIERRNQTISEITHDNQLLRDKINEMQVQIEELSEQQAQKTAQSTIDSITQESSIEIEKLKKRLERAQKQNDRYKQMEERNEEVENMINHYESEKEILYDLLQVEDEDSMDNWNKLRNKAKSLMVAYQDFDQLKQENDILLNKIHELEQENENSCQTKQETMNTLEEIQSLKQQIIQYQMSIDQVNVIKKFNEQQKIRNYYSALIAQHSHNLGNKINETFNAIMNQENEDMFRPLALMAVFIVRWQRIKQKKLPDQYECSSLYSYVAIPKNPYSSKIEKIQDAFLDLTKQLIQNKTLLNQFQKKQTHIDQKAANRENEIEELANEIEQLNHKLTHYRMRNSQLQEELARYVNHEVYQQSLTSQTNLEIENDSLKKEIEEISQELDDNKEIAKQQLIQIQEMHATQSAYEKEKLDLIRINEERCHEIELLQAKLKDRIKELLSLERIYYTQNNDNIININPVSDDTDLEYSTPINPKFLNSSSQ